MDEVIEQLSLLNKTVANINIQLNAINERNIVTDEKIAALQGRITDIDEKIELKVSSFESSGKTKKRSKMCLLQMDKKEGSFNESSNIIELTESAEGSVQKGEVFIEYWSIVSRSLKINEDLWAVQILIST